MAAVLFISVIFGSAAAFAGEISSLAWSDDDEAVLQIQIKGKASFTTSSLEGGQRLRLTFPDGTLGPAAGELERRGKVKGVYPYLADNATAVNVDLLLIEPGHLEVTPTDYGYRVVAQPGAGATRTTAATPAPATGGENVIKNIRYAVLPGSRVQVTLEMSQPPPQPTAFSITNPARIALDFPNTRVGLTKRSLPIKEGAVLNVTTIEAPDRTRVVLSLVRPVAYTTSTKGNTFAIILDTPVRAIAPAQKPRTTRFAAQTRPGKFSVRDIDFRRGSAGEGIIQITLSDPVVGIDLSEQAGQIFIDFLNTSISTDLQRRLDVVDFATPVQTIDSFPSGRDTRMVITPKGRFEQSAFQAGNVFTVNVKPILEKEEERPMSSATPARSSR
jgi:type IV pilus assembly protein PilQ